MRRTSLVIMMALILGVTACSTDRPSTSDVDNNTLSASLHSDASEALVDNESSMLIITPPSSAIETLRSPNLMGPSWQTWKNAVWDAWNNPENESAVAYVNDLAIPKRFVLFRNANVWSTINDNIERGALDDEQRRNAFIEQYGESFEQSRQHCIKYTAAYLDALKMGIDYSEDDARNNVKKQMEFNKAEDPSVHEIALEANGVTEEEYIERYTPMEQISRILAQYRSSILADLPPETTEEEAEAYYQQHLENLIKNYSIRIVD